MDINHKSTQHEIHHKFMGSTFQETIHRREPVDKAAGERRREIEKTRELLELRREYGDPWD